MTRTVKIILAVAVAAIAAGGYGVARSKRADPAPSAADAAKAAKAALAVLEFNQNDLYILQPAPLARTLALTGTLTPLVEATLKAKVAGELVEVPAREGQTVARGQV